jgi:hypothetical protein
MAEKNVVSATSRPPTEAELEALTEIKKYQAASIDNLEAAAKQIITLVSSFYGLIFGIIALGNDKFEAPLKLVPIRLFGGAAILLWLLALAAALAVIMPRPYSYRNASLTDIQTVRQALLTFKSNWLSTALGSFGAGLVAFAVVVITMLVNRG